MSPQNRYCCQCHRTTKFQVREGTFTCTQCGVVIEIKDHEKERSLIGDPFRSFRTRAA